MLLMGYSRSSGIPQMPIDSQARVDLNELAKKNDSEAKLRMKKDYDARMSVVESSISMGCQVLLKLDKKNKSTPSWDPEPYRVSAMNGSQITATRGDRSTTRNSSFFKLLRHCDDDDDVVEVELDGRVTQAPSPAAELVNTQAATGTVVSVEPSNLSESQQTDVDATVSGQVLPVITAARVGRPTKARSLEIQKAREEQEASRPTPERKSARLAKKAAKF
jgi:hypothetical protein